VSRSESELERLQDERDGAALYRGLAEAEANPRLAELFRRMAATEDRHAAAWAERLTQSGHLLPTSRVSLRTRALVFLARRLGTAAVLPTVAALEDANGRRYAAMGAGPETDRFAQEEGIHARLLRHAARVPGGIEGPALARIEGRHRGTAGNALRAAVLGANDGLVSNLSLVMGVAGAELSSHAILVTGLAGLIAGAGSMAMGEWLSVQSSRELFERQVRTEKAELEASPDEEAEELALIYQTKGLDEPHARKLASQMMTDRASALDTLVREELGLDPGDLGSPWGAAISSFGTFAVGAAIPVVPFLFLRGNAAAGVAAGAAALVLAGVGSLVGFLSGTPAWRSAGRMVGLAALAAGVTWLVGRLFGAAVG
jgi:VIT1/CCC1 family predicted Fe2+/Mn2+ transporter